jgi:hypothetical protein
MKVSHAATLALVGWYLPLLLGLGLLVAPSGAMPQQNSFDSFRAASPQPSASQHSDHLPSNPGSVPPSNSVQEIPQIYLGCWQGRQAQPDSWQQFSGPPVGSWIPATRTICFLRNPSGIEITSHKEELDEAANQGRIFNYQTQIFVTASSDRRIALRTFGSIQEYARYGSGAIGPLITVTSRADSICTMLPDGETMLVETSENLSCSGGIGCDGGPFVSTVRHAAFHRVPEHQSAH